MLSCQRAASKIDDPGGVSAGCTCSLTSRGFVPEDLPKLQSSTRRRTPSDRIRHHDRRYEITRSCNVHRTGRSQRHDRRRSPDGRRSWRRALSQKLVAGVPFGGPRGSSMSRARRALRRRHASVDLVPWVLYPNQAINAATPRSCRLRWPSVLSKAEFQQITGDVTIRATSTNASTPIGSAIT